MLAKKYILIRPAVILVLLSINLLLVQKASADSLIPNDLGRFTLGAGVYQAPNDAISDSGAYAFARYEISVFEAEVDYGLSDQNYFLGTADYMYYLPTAEGITQTAIAIGGGVTFINNDPALDESKMGFNLLAQARFMDKFSVQIRHDFLGKGANLWTFGLGYSFF